jgi:2-polyprenyl-6-methoxyphenol hydroxylase-like FAD-dependent oxidoreductase
LGEGPKSSSDTVPAVWQRIDSLPLRVDFSARRSRANAYREIGRHGDQGGAPDGADRFRGCIRAALKLADGSEELCEAAYLAACDGASSTAREQLRIGFPGGTYSGLFYVADVEVHGPPPNGELHADIEEADFALVFPLKERGSVRLVGTVREQPNGEQDRLTFEDVRGRAIEHLKLS